MFQFSSVQVLSLAALSLALGGCGDSGAPSNRAQLNFNVATLATPAATGGSLATSGAPETFTDGTNTLVITGVQLVLREIELRRAAASSDCLGGSDDDCEKLETGPELRCRAYSRCL